MVAHHHPSVSPHVHDFTDAEFAVLSRIWHDDIRYADMTPEERAVWNHYRRNISAAHRQPDDAVIQRALAGYRPTMNLAERRAAIDILLDKGGMSLRGIADLLGISANTVSRRALNRSKNS